MRVPEVLLLDTVIGLMVAGLAHRQTGEYSALCGLLWPLWLPMQLAPADASYDTAHSPTPTTQADAPPELARLQELLTDWDSELVISATTLRDGLRQLTERRAELQLELSRPENNPKNLDAACLDASSVGDVARRRRENVQAMRDLHKQLDLDLRTALAQVQELCSRVQLARFHGAASAGVGTELNQLVAAVESAREVQALGRYAG